MSGYGVSSRLDAGLRAPALLINARGRSQIVLVCDHASNFIPEKYDGLGLSATDRLAHIAWDPGALSVSHRLSVLLDAPLVHSTISRLVIDCNRTETAPDLIPTLSEMTEIPGNRNLDAAERHARILAYHAPFHALIDRIVDERTEIGMPTILVAIHSFTPIYKHVPRPWPIGLIHGADETFSRLLQRNLGRDAPEMNIGWNQPYAASDNVYYTLGRHADDLALQATMVEIRNDEILEPDGVALWADRMARCLTDALGALAHAPVAATDQIGLNLGGTIG